MFCGWISVHQTWNLLFINLNNCIYLFTVLFFNPLKQFTIFHQNNKLRQFSSFFIIHVFQFVSQYMIIQYRIRYRP